MRVPTRIGYALGVAAAVALFAGCSGSGSSMNSVAPVPMQPQSVVRNHVPIIAPASLLRSVPGQARTVKGGVVNPDVTSTLFYTCTFTANFCEWFVRGTNAVAGTISSGLTNPQGIGVDSLGNVWVADTGGSDIQVFHKGRHLPFKTLSDPGQFPVGVAIDGVGNAFVANIFNTSFGPGSISVYKAGSLTPTRMITDPRFFQVISVALDENHLLISCYNTSGGVGQCDEFPSARGHGTNIISGLFFAGGVAFDNLENIVVNDQTVAIDQFSGLSPFGSCASSSAKGRDYVMLALDRSNDDILEADASNGVLREQVFADCSNITGGGEKAYSAGLTASDTVIGAAVDPAPAP